MTYWLLELVLVGLEWKSEMCLVQVQEKEGCCWRLISFNGSELSSDLRETRARAHRSCDLLQLRFMKHKGTRLEGTSGSMGKDLTSVVMLDDYSGDVWWL